MEEERTFRRGHAREEKNNMGKGRGDVDMIRQTSSDPLGCSDRFM